MRNARTHLDSFIMQSCLLSPVGYEPKGDSVTAVAYSPDYSGSPFFTDEKVVNYTALKFPCCINNTDLKNVVIGSGCFLECVFFLALRWTAFVFFVLWCDFCWQTVLDSEPCATGRSRNCYPRRLFSHRRFQGFRSHPRPGASQVVVWWSPMPFKQWKNPKGNVTGLIWGDPKPKKSKKRWDFSKWSQKMHILARFWPRFFFLRFLTTWVFLKNFSNRGGLYFRG